MLAEIFMLRLEAAARVAAQEAPKYSLGTGAERKTWALLNIRRGDLESLARSRASHSRPAAVTNDPSALA
jgi:hypothetical protein